MVQSVDGKTLAAMLVHASASLNAEKQKINELNVFPVPDGDTGTNMGLTLGTAAAELRQKAPTTAAQASALCASAMLRGARGNSGVILSLIFRGFSRAMKDKDTMDGIDLADALNAGVVAAYKAVMKPAEGTVLTVSRLAGDRAGRAAEENTAFEYVLGSALERAREALADTVNQNPVLKKAGVVDAGGMGFVVILQGMLDELHGIPAPADDQEPSPVPQREKADFGGFETGEIQFGYCTEFICSRDTQKDPEALRAFLNGLGDSLVLVDDDEIIKVHVHTNNPGTALQEALTYGSFVTVKIENMRLQHTEKVMSEQELQPQIAPPEKKFGVVTVCAGDGIASVFRDLGVDGVISGGQTMNPSTQDILTAVNQVPAETVFVFPNNKNIIMAAEQVDPLTEKTVIVIPSTTIPQGITAMLSYDPEGSRENNVEAMTGALDQVDTMQITYAARDSDFDGHQIHQGDYLAMYGKSLFATSRDLNAVLRSLAEKVRDTGREYITIFYGEDITEKQASKAAGIFSSVCPHADVNLLSGGQPVYYYLISAE